MIYVRIYVCAGSCLCFVHGVTLKCRMPSRGPNLLKDLCIKTETTVCVCLFVAYELIQLQACLKYTLCNQYAMCTICTMCTM